MPQILNVKFKGNKTFIPFSNLTEVDSVWKICSKVSKYLEQGQRMENLSWRLWHIQSVLCTDDSNFKAKKEFRKLSKTVGEKCDREKGMNIEDLEAPAYKATIKANLLKPRTQFIFSKEAASSQETLAKPVVGVAVKRGRGRPPKVTESRDVIMTDAIIPAHDSDPLFIAKPSNLPDLKLVAENFEPESASTPPAWGQNYHSRLWATSGLADEAMYEDPATPQPAPNTATAINYNSTAAAAPTPTKSAFETALPESDVEAEFEGEVHSSKGYESDRSSGSSDSDPDYGGPMLYQTSTSSRLSSSQKRSSSVTKTSNGKSRGRGRKTQVRRPSVIMKTERDRAERLSSRNVSNSVSVPVQAVTVAPRVTTAVAATSSAGVSTVGTGTGPGGQKAECSNCGATHTPLWRRGLNDELNCNACGLYCKLHKRPRPRTMRNSQGGIEGATSRTVVSSSGTVVVRPEVMDVMAQCYNCHTTATPLWRKDDEGKTVCNACGLYYKLHGSSRPISMKSDVIRKRSRNEARRGEGDHDDDTASGSPSASRQSSPAPGSPILAPDSTTKAVEYSEDSDSAYRSEPSDSMTGTDDNDTKASSVSDHPESSYLDDDDFGTGLGNNNLFSAFPGPFHPDYINRNFNHFGGLSDPLPFSQAEIEKEPTAASMVDAQQEAEARVNKRRRMSVDSLSEPPSSAVSYSSFADGSYSSRSRASSTSQSVHSHTSSVDFPYSAYPSYGIFRSNAAVHANNSFWHPPMVIQENRTTGNKSSYSSAFHPPMVNPATSTSQYQSPLLASPNENSLDFTQPSNYDEVFASYMHPPAVLPEDTKAMTSSWQQKQQGQHYHSRADSLQSNHSFDSDMHNF